MTWGSKRRREGLEVRIKGGLLITELCLSLESASLTQEGGSALGHCHLQVIH